MHRFSRQDHNAFIEENAQKEYGWDDWLDDYSDFVHPRAYYGRRSSQKCSGKHSQKANTMANRSFRLSDHKKERE